MKLKILTILTILALLTSCGKSTTKEVNSFGSASFTETGVSAPTINTDVIADGNETEPSFNKYVVTDENHPMYNEIRLDIEKNILTITNNSKYEIQNIAVDFVSDIGDVTSVSYKNAIASKGSSKAIEIKVNGKSKAKDLRPVFYKLDYNDESGQVATSKYDFDLKEYYK